MKATELRIGNYFKKKDSPHPIEVDSIGKDGISLYNCLMCYDHVDPPVEYYFDENV
ncbi:hypothetical protein LCGC14_1074440 [marine sediment metagenome]|uniref:Uncharacterized protein n=1 Tax=marine sediment metagenome TaxID=412755 RepID=A0A0F9N4H8_9ZZZZ